MKTAMRAMYLCVCVFLGNSVWDRMEPYQRMGLCIMRKSILIIWYWCWERLPGMERTLIRTLSLTHTRGCSHTAIPCPKFLYWLIDFCGLIFSFFSAFKGVRLAHFNRCASASKPVSHQSTKRLPFKFRWSLYHTSWPFSIRVLSSSILSPLLLPALPRRPPVFYLYMAPSSWTTNPSDWFPLDRLSFLRFRLLSVWFWVYR